MKEETEKNLGGRPPMFSTPEALIAKIQEYFNSCESSSPQTPPTITGLCLFLGFESRQSFYDYEEKDGFTYAIKKARLMIEKVYEEKLHGPSPTGAIFALKNFGWTDKQEIDHTSKGEAMGFMLNVKADKGT